jgi:hypothetical protein
MQLLNEYQTKQVSAGDGGATPPDQSANGPTAGTTVSIEACIRLIVIICGKVER